MKVEREVSFKLTMHLRSGRNSAIPEWSADDAISEALEQFEFSLSRNKDILTFDLTEEKF